jgi:hypothetical protein
MLLSSVVGSVILEGLPGMGRTEGLVVSSGNPFVSLTEIQFQTR